ncbi:Di-copper centre-containing protein [Penicillium herquei]|nr:Di-copper centre-containing protein [Penicillium herquei]
MCLISQFPILFMVISEESQHPMYSGPARYGKKEEAALTDLLEYGGILPFDPSVADLMDTEGEFLSYRYDLSAAGQH